MTIEGWRRDARQAWTGSRRAPGVALAAVLTLALGLGANFALFSALDAVLWRSLPVPQPREIRLLQRGNGDARFSYPLIQDLRRALGGRARLAAMTREPAAFDASGQGVAGDELRAQLVSGNFFSVLEVQPWRGRLLEPADNAAPEGRAVAVISYEFWRVHFHGAGALGATLTLNRVPVEIVGVAPPGFAEITRGDAAQAWLPLRLQRRLAYFRNAALGSGDPEAAWADQAGISWLQAVARVAPGENLTALAARATAAERRDLAPGLPGAARPRERALRLAARIELRPGATLLNALARRIARPLWILEAMAGLVLLVACLNLAMLMLARGAARQREYAVRLAVGAGRGALLRQAMAEGLILAGLGGAAGFLLALWGRTALLAALGVSHAPAVLAGGTGLSAGFAVFLSLAAGAGFSLAPGWRASRVAPLAALQGRGAGGGRRQGRALVIGQAAAALVLLIVAGLLGRSLVALMQADSGHAPGRVLLVHIDPRAAGYRPQELPALYQRMISRLDALPGVQASGLALCGAACESSGRVRVIAGGSERRNLSTDSDAISPGYLQAMGVRLIRGRAFAAGDSGGAPPVAIVNETFARRYLGDFDPLAARVGAPAGAAPPAAIVGVAADARLDPRRPPPPMVFYPLAQAPDYVESLAVRARGGAGPLAAAVRGALAQAAPAMPAGGMTTLAARVAGSWRDEAALVQLSGGLALLALGLGCLGLYGVAAYGVARRSAEIGMRMALGARRGQVFRLIWSEALRATLAGAVLGLAAAWPLARLARGVLFGIGPLDAATWLAALAALFAAATLAAWGPARRAARLDPWAALRHE